MLEWMGTAAEDEVGRLPDERPANRDDRAEIVTRRFAASRSQNCMVRRGFMMEAKVGELGEKRVLLESSRRKELFS